MASRIEQLNKEFQSQLLISEDVMNAMDDIMGGIKLYKDVSIKGFENPVSMYKVA